LYLALGNRGARVITLEGCQETAALAEKNFSALKLNNVTLVTGKFSEALPDVLLSLQTADMVFIDGDHRKEALLEYFTLIIPYIHNDSVVVVDDIRWSPEMAEAWTELCRHEKVKVSVDLFQLGILFFKEELSKQDFVISYS
jgi:predicted O-methyltransferase YrrM